MRKKIDLETWERKRAFNTFSNYMNPFTGVVTKIDITNLLFFTKEYSQSFYGVMIYFVLSAMNDIESFKYGYGKENNENKVFKFDEIAATATILQEDSSLNFTRYIKFEENLMDFLLNFEQAKNDAKNGIEYYKIPNLDNMNKINVTCLPWIKFTNFKDAINFKEQSSKPKVCWGKYYKEDDKYFIDFSILVNHAFQDGYHIGMFINTMQETIHNFNNYDYIEEKGKIYEKRK